MDDGQLTMDRGRWLKEDGDSGIGDQGLGILVEGLPIVPGQFDINTVQFWLS